MEQRLIGLGIKGATVHAAGTTLLATVPASALSTLRTMAGTAGVLRFRQVLAVTTPATSSPPTSTNRVVAHRTVTQASTLSTALLRTFSRWDCLRQGTPTTNDVASDYILSCDTGGSTETTYLLAPASIGGSGISSADTQLTSTGRWVVSLNFTNQGGRAWQQLTARTYDIDHGVPDVEVTSCGPPTGCNAIAITLDGLVVSAPYSETAGGIPGGNTQISGSFTQKTARQLADVVKYGALPTTFHLATTG